jgi:ABC-type sugar transport system ATPase subunit
VLEVADRIIVLVDGEVRMDTYSSQTHRDQIVVRMSEVA